MKIHGFAIIGFLSLVSGSVARRGNRFGASGSCSLKRQSGSLSLTDEYARIRTSPLTKACADDNDPLSQKSRVTAFINTDEGLKVECWEIGDLLPQNQVTREDGSKGTVNSWTLAGNLEITLFSFAPSVTIFSFGASGMHSNAIDFRAKPNLFTVKDGLVFIEAHVTSGRDVAAEDDDLPFVFADVNGDDWFYFEDESSLPSSSEEQCAKPMSRKHFTAQTISGSDTTLINFQYQRTPTHKVLHEGRCNFAGLKPVSSSSQRDDPDFRFRSQE